MKNLSTERAIEQVQSELRKPALRFRSENGVTLLFPFTSAIAPRITVTDGPFASLS